MNLHPRSAPLSPSAWLARLVHVGAGGLLAWWGHVHWPLTFAGLLPLAAWLALSATAQLDDAAPADGAQRAAWLGMLPMMGGLPTMLDLCSSAGGGLLMVAAGHVAAMVLPLALMAALPLRWQLARSRSRLCAALLVAGGVLLLAVPGVQGLTLAMLAHAAAWSLVVCEPASAPRAASVGTRALPTLALLAFGAALDAFGAIALFMVHAGLALAGLACLAAPHARHVLTTHWQTRTRHPAPR